MRITLFGFSTVDVLFFGGIPSLRDRFIRTTVDITLRCRLGRFGYVTCRVNRVLDVTGFIEYSISVLCPLFCQFLAQVSRLLEKPVTGVYSIPGPAAALRLLRPYSISMDEMRQSHIHVWCLSLAADDTTQMTHTVFLPIVRQYHRHRPEVCFST